MGQIKSIFHEDLSLGDTSTKFGTNDVQDVLFKKSTLSSWKSKMATSFQDGCLIKCKKRKCFRSRTWLNRNVLMIQTSKWMYSDWKNSMVSTEFQYGHQFSRWQLLRDSKLEFSGSCLITDIALRWRATYMIFHWNAVVNLYWFMIFYKSDVKAQPGHTGDITAVRLSMGFSVSL